MAEKIPTFAAFGVRNFRYLWIGMLIARIGAEMQVVAMIWQIYEITHSPISLGIIGIARFLPVIGFSLLGGVAADIWERKHIIVTAQLLQAICALILFIASITGHIFPTVIYIAIGIISAIASFDIPARQSLIPALIPKKLLMNAMSLNSIMWDTAIVVGPMLAGFALGVTSATWVYFFIFVLLSLSGIVLAQMHPTKKPGVHTTTASLDSIMEGIRFVSRAPLIWSTMLLDFFATFFSSATVLLPIFAKDILAVGPIGLGFLYAAPSLGSIVAGLILSSMRHIHHQGKVLIASVCVYGLATIFFGFSHNFYLSLFFLFFIGAGDVVSAIIRNAIRNMVTPEHMRGRMVSINMIFFMGGPQLGEVEGGLLAASIGTPLSVVIGGVGTIIATLIVAALVPKLRKYRGDEIN